MAKPILGLCLVTLVSILLLQNVEQTYGDLTAAVVKAIVPDEVAKAGTEASGDAKDLLGHLAVNFAVGKPVNVTLANGQKYEGPLAIPVIKEA